MNVTANTLDEGVTKALEIGSIYEGFLGTHKYLFIPTAFTYDNRYKNVRKLTRHRGMSLTSIGERELPEEASVAFDSKKYKDEDTWYLSDFRLYTSLGIVRKVEKVS